MNEDNTCLIWGTPAKQMVDYSREGLYLTSPRAGGEYFVNGMAGYLVSKLNDRKKAKLTTWLIEQRRLGVERPEISPCENEMESIVQRPDLTVHARADELLKYIKKNTLHIGRAFLASEFLPDTFAYTESVDPEELQYLTDYLIRKGWLEKSTEATIALIVTVEGYARLAELETVVVVSSKAFVARWFDDSLDPVFEEAVKPAIKDAGYDAMIVNEEHFLDKIDDQIIAEINRARFVIADFTHGNSGARGSVYYEAGFAQGLGKDVIFTCRKDMIDNNEIHFDIRQYPYVVWENNDLEGFRKSLTFRIERVIGDGPLKSVPGEQEIT